MNTTDSPENVSAEALLAQISDEFLEALEGGEQPDMEEYAQRYPELAEVLRQVLPALAVLRQPPSNDASAEGAVSGVLGDFRIVREVGRGGMGVVYEAKQISLRRRVALKVLPLAATMDARQLQRFHNEARAAAGLHQEHIVPVHAVGCERGVHFYAMQFIAGRTLAEWIEQQRAPNGGLGVPTGAYQPPADGSSAGETVAGTAATSPPATAATSGPGRDAAGFRRVAEWGVQAAEALEYAHSVGVVHRDIKPGNLMIDAQGKLWVTDFGLARTATDSGLTLSGDLVGTLRYMSPEQALARHGLVDHRTDVYSLSVTLYELLTLRPAVDGKDRQEILQRIAFEEPDAPRSLNPALPRDLETIVLKAMSKEPRERYGSARELADDLRRFLEDRPIVAQRPTIPQHLARWARRHRNAVWAAMLVLVLLIAGLLTGTGLLWQEQSRTRVEADAKDEALRRMNEALVQKDQALTRADANFLKALDGVGHTVDGLGEYRPNLPPEVVTVRSAVLHRARSYFVGFLEQNRYDPALRLETLLAHGYLSAIQEKQQDLLGASQSLREALLLGETLAAGYPDHSRYQQEMSNLKNRVHRLSVQLNNRAMVEEASGHFARAEELALAAFGLVDRWGAADSSADGLLKAMFLVRLSETLRTRHHLKKAAALREQSTALLNRQATTNPTLTGICMDQRFVNTRHLAELLIATGEGERAEHVLQQDLQHLAVLPADVSKRCLVSAEVHGANLHACRADVLRVLGRTKEANQEARPALKHLPPSSVVRAWLLATVPDPDLRDARKTVGLFESRIDDLARDSSASPLDAAAAWTGLGIARLEAAENKAAIEALEKAHKLFPGGARGTLFYLATAHARQGKQALALQWYGQAVASMNKEQPDNLELRRLRAEAATLLGVKEPTPTKESPTSKP